MSVIVSPTFAISPSGWDAITASWAMSCSIELTSLSPTSMFTPTPKGLSSGSRIRGSTGPKSIVE